MPAVVGALTSLFAPGAASRAVSDGARALFETRRFWHPVVLMVDEAQDVRPSSREAGIVRMLHQGHVSEIPVLPVLAGLGHLREHLGQPGIRLSRLSDERRSAHTLGALSDGEVRELFAGWLDRFGVAAGAGGAAHWFDALVRDSQGWPMHTNHFLTSLARELLTPGRDPGRLDAADLDAVRRDAAGRRLAYYDTRYDHELVQEHGHGVGRAMTAIRGNGPADLRNTLDTIQGAFQYGDREDARRTFGVLRERGFLQRASEPDTPLATAGTRRVFDCPIPSLASYAAARGRAAHEAAMLGDAAPLGRLLRADPGAVHARDAMGRAPLHLAAECRWTDVTETLLAAGGDPDAPDAAGATARGTWPEFDWPKSGPEKKHDNGGGSGTSGGPGGMG